MSDRLNAIILDGEMYVLAETLGKSDCAVCDLRDCCGRDDGNFACTVFGVESGYCFKHAPHMVRGEEIIHSNRRQIITYKQK